MILKRASRTQFSLAATAVVSIGLTLLLYGTGVTLPFYSDDLLQVPWAKATPVLDTWGTVNPYEHYRPVQSTLWWLAFLLTGDLRPELLHALNLVGHALCGVLVGMLVARFMDRPRLAAPLATALFVAFPFGFDVVLWPCAFGYPLAVALALGSILLYSSARDNKSLPQHGVAVVLAALAGFAHEAGVVAGALVLMTELAVAKGRFSRWPVAYVAGSLVPLVAIVRIVPSHGLTSHHTLADLAIVAQALAHPVAPLALVTEQWNVDASLAVLWIGAVALVVLAYGAYRIGQLKWFGFGVGWVLAWSSIPFLTQQFDWLRDPPRVLYPSAVGIAVMWGVGLLGLPPRRDGWLASWLGCVLLLGALAPSALFLVGRMDVYQRAGDLLWEIVETARGDGTTLFVNVPGRITPAERFYPLGHEGVIPLPPPTDVEMLVEVHSGKQGVAVERTAGGILPRLRYGVELAGQPLEIADLRVADNIMIVTYHPDGLSLERLGAMRPPQDARPAVARFGDRLSLLSAACHWLDSDSVVLRATWQVLAPVEGEPTVFAHLLGSDGGLLTQADGPPLRGLYPFAEWRPGEVVEEVRVFEGVGPEAAAVVFGVWDPSAGTRWAASGVHGERLRDDACRCEVQVERGR